MTPDEVFKFLEAFSSGYVAKWGNTERVNAGGWAILQAGHALRVAMQLEENKAAQRDRDHGFKTLSI